MRVLFVAVHSPDRAPGQRFRFEQYLNYLRARGITCDYSWVLGDQDARTFYGNTSPLHKAAIAGKALAKRGLDTLQLLSRKRYDVVFVQREAVFLGPPFFEWVAKHSGAKLVYDFDDAIWQHAISDANRRFAVLKNTAKIPQIIAMSHLVFAGNEYLASYARQHNQNVRVVPTTVDTDHYVGDPRKRNNALCIGWSGSFSTIAHFKTAEPALLRVKQRMGERVTFRVIGDDSYTHPALGITGIKWTRETELAELQRIDIGIMPLPNDEWSRGKCGLKGLLYMSLGIPALLSPVGVNSDIIQHGVNGFLPNSEDEWVEQLCALVEQPALRDKIGAAGRQTAIDKFSVHAWKDTYFDVLTQLARRSVD